MRDAQKVLDLAQEVWCSASISEIRTARVGHEDVFIVTVQVREEPKVDDILVFLEGVPKMTDGRVNIEDVEQVEIH